MPEPISTGALIVGAGWAGKKVLGPSLDEFGGQLRIYAGERIKKIFEALEKKKPDVTKLNPLPPAFTLKFVQSASLSDDDEILTGMWANLLINASSNYSNRKVLFVDILETLSVEDAKVLDSLIVPGRSYEFFDNLGSIGDLIRLQARMLAERILREAGLTHFDDGCAHKFNNELENLKFDNWPIKIIGSRAPYDLTKIAVQENVIYPALSSMGIVGSLSNYDPLIRQRLLQTFQFDFVAGFEIEVDGVMATSLGIDFLQNCRGSEQ